MHFRSSTATIEHESESSRLKAAEVGDARFIPHGISVEMSTVAAADLNGDGHQDLVNAGEPELTIYLGRGDGEFDIFSRAPGGQQPDEIALADLDGDGDLDITIANHDTDHLTILLGDGTGVFQSARSSPLRINVSPHPHVVKAADIDADGHVDLIVDHRDGEGLLILRGLGEGEFKLPGRLVGVGGDPYRGMAVGDIDGDGLLDLVTPNPREIGVLINTSDGGINFSPGTSVAAAAPFAVGLGDFNGDRLLDLIAASDEGSALVQLFVGDGQGGFQEANDSPFSLAPGAKNIVVGDFNGDGISDAAVACYHFTEVLLLLGGSDSIRTGMLPGDEHPWGLAAADFNEDGKDDLIIADDTTHTALLYLTLEE